MSRSVDAPMPRTTFASAPRRQNLLRLLGLETRAEFLKLARMPAFAIPTFAFPLMFYVLFGLAFGRGQQAGSMTMAAYLLASYGAFGVIGVNLSSLGIGIASERGQGWMLLKRALPLPPVVHFIARICVGMVFSLLVVLSLFAFAGFFGGVVLPLSAWLRLAGWLVIGGVPVAALGLALGYLCGPNSAPAVINLIYLPTSFTSGLWLPYEILPGFFKSMAPWLPGFHLAQQGLGIIGGTAHPSWVVSVTYLTIFTVLCLVAGVIAYRRDQQAWG